MARDDNGAWLAMGILGAAAAAGAVMGRKGSRAAPERPLSASALKLLTVMSQKKGATSMVNMSVLTEALEHLGWRVEEVEGAHLVQDYGERIIPKLIPNFYQKHPKADLYFSSLGGWLRYMSYPDRTVDEARTRAALADLSLEATPVGKKGPTEPKEGKLYFYHLPMYRDDLGFDGIKFWVGVPAWKISSPTSSIVVPHPLTSRGVLDDAHKLKPSGFWSWAYKNGLQQAATAKVGKDGAEKLREAIRLENPRSLLGTGTCPVCDRNVVLTDSKRIMRHGWAVQGDGYSDYVWHSGPCFGFQFPPIEISLKGASEYLDRIIKPSQVGAASRLPILKAGPDTIHAREWKKTVEISRPDDWPQNQYSPYAKALNADIMRAEAEIEALKRARIGLEAKIKNWKPRPLPGT